MQLTAEVAQQGGFAASAGAHDADDLPARDGEIDALQHLERAVRKVQVFDLDEIFHALIPSLSLFLRFSHDAAQRYTSFDYRTRFDMAGVVQVCGFGSQTRKHPVRTCFSTVWQLPIYNEAINAFLQVKT